MVAYYAHSTNNCTEEWQTLEAHLTEVASIAAQHAAAFSSEAWGRLAGLWHDLGKYQPQFQQKLKGERIAVEHSGAGALLAFETSRDRGAPLAFVIAGHHSGLPNRESEGAISPLRQRLLNNRDILKGLRAQGDIPASILHQVIPALPPWLSASGDEDAKKRSCEFWIRFLFSALVDADSLETARFYRQLAGGGAVRASLPARERGLKHRNQLLPAFLRSSWADREEVFTIVCCPDPIHLARQYCLGR